MQMSKTSFTTRVALIVALGGFLMGFDASVISGVNKFVQAEFDLSDLQLGFSVSSLTIIAALAMMITGPLSDRFGRRLLLKYCALVFAISAFGSAFASSYYSFLFFRMLGGIGVGASLILAPMYIAEIAPAKGRGRLVSFNQLNIVLGITIAFFSNYFIVSLVDSSSSIATMLHLSSNQWRWMLGIEIIPAIIYFIALFTVPRSPRWLVSKSRNQEALEVLNQFLPKEQAIEDLANIEKSISQADAIQKARFSELFKPALRTVLAIGILVSVLQQITGINAVFFYAPMIFEQSGIGTNASFIQAVLVGITNLVFTVIALLLIDKIGRRPLLLFGIGGIVVFMGILTYGFNSATYSLESASLTDFPQEIQKNLSIIQNEHYTSDVTFKKALLEVLGTEKAKMNESELLASGIQMNPTLILVGILGFVACFAVSLGPVMWVLFSELFPMRIRGIAISFVGFINSAVSAIVQFVFPWELSTLGSSNTFMIYGIFALIGFFFVMLSIPETKGRTLEELEQQLG